MNRSLFLAFAACGVLLASGCSRTPPPNWATGGQALQVQKARWHLGEDDAIVIEPDGKVTDEDGDIIFSIDAAGRVFETDGDPIAVLQSDGLLIGEDDVHMGFIGPVSASFPGAPYAWFTIEPNGQVIRYDSEGERKHGGHWEGCYGPQVHACSLVTHVHLLREWQRRPKVGVGIGIGMGVPLR